METVTQPNPDGLKQDRKAPERTCIVTREACDKAQLIRFVEGPDSVVVPDVAGKLPGRGCWGKAQYAIVQRAVDEKRFARALKKPVNVPYDLSAQTARLLETRAEQSLALARKAGRAIQGFDKVHHALLRGDVLAILHAADAAEDGKRKLADAAVWQDSSLTREQLSRICGVENATHVALLKGEGAEKMLQEIRRFTGFVEKSAL